MPWVTGWKLLGYKAEFGVSLYLMAHRWLRTTLRMIRSLRADQDSADGDIDLLVVFCEASGAVVSDPKTDY